MDVSKTELKRFQKIAKKYGVDFVVVKDENNEPPIYLDVVVEYIGDEREDDMFNLLHKDRLSIGGVDVDININHIAYKTGTLEKYLPRVEKYLEEKCQKVSVREKVKKRKSEIRVKDEKADKGCENVR